MRQEKGRLFPYFRNQFVQVVRRGCACARLDSLRIRYVFQKSVVIIVDQLALLPLTETFNCQRQLLLDLIIWRAINILNGRVHIDNGRYGIEAVFPWFTFVLHIPLRDNIRFLCLAAQNVQRGISLNDLVHAVNTCFKSFKFKQLCQPLRGDCRKLRSRLGDIGEIIGRLCP